MQNLCAQASAVGSQSIQNATYSVLCRLVSIQNTANALVNSGRPLMQHILPFLLYVLVFCHTTSSPFQLQLGAAV